MKIHKVFYDADVSLLQYHKILCKAHNMCTAEDATTAAKPCITRWECQNAIFEIKKTTKKFRHQKLEIFTGKHFHKLEKKMTISSQVPE